MSVKTIIRIFIFLVCSAAVAVAQPVADFSADKTSGCAPLLVSFTDLSTGNPVSWQWDFGNGNTSTLQKPSVIYANPGTYEVKLTIKDATNATATKTRTSYIQVFAQPKADFTVDKASACPQSPFAFTDASVKGAGNINQWQWDFGDGLGANTASPSHAYSSSGSYTVRLTIKDDNGCSNFKELAVPLQVFPVPNAKISPSKTASCLAPATINFANLTAGTNTYLWDLGGGNTSSQTNTSQTFNTPGTYKVKLIATSADGCNDTDEVSISIGNNKAGFTLSPANTCINATVTLTPDLSGNMLGYTFLYGDGTSTDETKPSTHAYGAPGVYKVSMIAFFGDGCSDTVTKEVTVDEIPDVTVNYTPKYSCTVPFNATFTNPIANSTSSWDFGDGQTSTQKNVIHTYSSKGPFVVSLTVTTAGGCMVTKTDTIDFRPELEVISSQKLFCGASSGAVSFTYDPKYTTPVNPVSHAWTFGDGNTSTLKNPSHTYTTEGTFIVKLALTYTGGCVIEGWDTIKVYTDPFPDFVTSLRDVCVRTVVQFINKCQNCDSAIWNFGDKIITPVKLPMPPNTHVVHPYFINPLGIPKLTDTFDIKLTVFNGPCQKDTIFPKHIRVRAPLAYTEPVTLYCDTPANAILTDISRYQNPRDSVTRLWVFGDPYSEVIGGQPCIVNTKSGINIGRNCNQSVDSIARHTYKRFGNFNAYLRTYSKTTGCTDSFQFQIKVRPKFNLKFTVSDDTACAPFSLVAKDTTRTSVRWKWFFGDPLAAPADTAVSRDTAWRYTRPGNYTLKLMATDTSGCEQTATKQIVVRGPLANFGVVGKLCPPDTTKFTDLTVKTSRIQRWKWNFGDPGSGAQNDTSNLANTQHKFSKLGNFVVSLTVVDSEQCVNTIAKLIPYGPPKPDFSIDKNIICQGMGVSFTNSTPGANVYQWLFGDTTTSTVKNPTHIYKDTGTFQVKLIAKRTDGCSDSLSNISVRVVKPKVDFTADNTNAFCPPFTVRFNDSVTTDIVEWKWDFGDSSYSSVPNPIKTYNKPGIYTVKLLAKSAGGCEDSITYTDYIKVGGPVGQFSFTPRNGCIPLGVGFKAVTVGAVTQTWDFGNGNVSTTTTDTTYHIYTASGTFKPVLILTDSNNCAIPYASPDSIYLLPGSKADFTANDTAICVGGNVVFIDRSKTPPGVSIVSRLWKFGDLSTATTNPVAHIYTTSGSFDVSLTITDDRGCTDTLSKPAYIQSSLKPTVAVSTDTAMCAGAAAQLNASGGVVYRWSPATGLSDPEIANPVATPLSTTTYKVAAKGAGSCDTAYGFVTITIHALPTVDAGLDTFICKGDSIRLNAMSSGNTYAWYPPEGLTDTTITDPYVRIENSMEYYVQVTDANYCVNTDSIKVDVVEPPTADVTGPQQVCYNAVIKLRTTAADSYLWSSGEQTQEITANIKKDTSYWVIPFTKGCKGVPDTIDVKITGDVIEADFVTSSDTLFTHKSILFTNTSKGAIDYLWDFMWGEMQTGKTSAEKDPVYEYKRYGTYTIRLIATSDIGCKDTIYKKLLIINNNVFIPNAFSPDGDNINDIFNFVASDSLERFEFRVYNRWGQEVFVTNIEEQGWDGRYGGAPAQQDVYVYVFEGIVNNRDIVLTGTVTLLR